MQRSFLTFRWILTTLFVMIALAGMIRLGFWQIDRLAQRRAFNARVTAQMTALPLNLGAHLDDPDLVRMEYRPVVVTGEYDHEQQVALRNQVANGAPGYHLITPLVIQGTGRVVLVDRGWIPLEDAMPEEWRKYDEPGMVTVEGVIRNSRPRQGIAGVPDPTLAPGQERLAAWNFLDLQRIEGQLDQPALPVYIHQLPDAAWQGIPIRGELDLDLSEGSHASYAIQWFSFAAVLAIGYPIFVYRTLSPKSVGVSRRESLP